MERKTYPLVNCDPFAPPNVDLVAGDKSRPVGLDSLHFSLRTYCDSLMMTGEIPPYSIFLHSSPLSFS